MNHPDEPLPDNVVGIHRDGVRIRMEVRNGVALYWAERYRSNRSTVAVLYDREELQQLRDAIDRVLR